MGTFLVVGVLLEYGRFTWNLTGQISRPVYFESHGTLEDSHVSQPGSLQPYCQMLVGDDYRLAMHSWKASIQTLEYLRDRAISSFINFCFVTFWKFLGQYTNLSTYNTWNLIPKTTQNILELWLLIFTCGLYGIV